MSRKITSDICFGLLTMILLTGGAWPQNAAAPANGMHQSGEWTTHAHDAQHTGVSPVASQKLAKIHWQVPVDLAPRRGLPKAYLLVIKAFSIQYFEGAIKHASEQSVSCRPRGKPVPECFTPFLQRNVPR
jgi:hypothetical protein